MHTIVVIIIINIITISISILLSILSLNIKAPVNSKIAVIINYYHCYYNY